MITKYNQYIKESLLVDEKKFIINKKKYTFELYLNDILVAHTGFEIERTDKWFKQKYITIFELKTEEEQQRKGYAKYLLEQIFDYVKNKLNINIISLLVYKDNIKAVNLYLNSGFEIFQDSENINSNLDDSDKYFILIKKLNI